MNGLPLMPAESLWCVREQWLNSLAMVIPAFLKADHSQIRAVVSLPVAIVDNIAIIDVMGAIEKRPSLFGAFTGMTSAEVIKAAVRTATTDPAVKRILLRVDSPGGTTDGTAEAADAVFEARQFKPVIAQSDGMVASAAYWIASQATKINAGRLDLIGSLGVRLMLYDFSQAFENAGVRPVPIDTGGMKSVGQPGTKITVEQEGYLQRIVDAFGNAFKGAIARGRDMPMATVNRLFDGEVNVAPAAKSLGLIDKIATFDETLVAIRSQAGRQRARRARAAMMDKAEPESKFDIPEAIRIGKAQLEG